MRISEALRDAAALADEHLHVAPSTTALTADTLRNRLEAVVLQAALDSHYREHPKARPSLADLAVAAAQLDGHPLASEADLAVAVDPVSGRTVQRSFTFRGERPAAEAWCRELAEEYARRRAAHREAPFLTVGELLARWIDAEHDWKPLTVCGYRSNIRGLNRDEVLNSHRVVSVTPVIVRHAMARWAAAGAGPSVVGIRFRVLRSAIGWAYLEGIIDRHPLATMRGPARGEPRRHLPTDDISRSTTQTSPNRSKPCLPTRVELRQIARPERRACRSAAQAQRRLRQAAMSVPVNHLPGCGIRPRVRLVGASRGELRDLAVQLRRSRRWQGAASVMRSLRPGSRSA